MHRNWQRGLFASALLALLAMQSVAPADAAPKIGSSCAAAGKTQRVGTKTLICAKTRGKLVWVSRSAPKTPMPTPTPTLATVSPVSWLTVTDPVQTSNGAFQSFSAYMGTVRNPNSTIVVYAQDGADPIWSTWINDTALKVAWAFDYPPLTQPFYDVLAFDKEWLVKTYTDLGFSAAAVQDRIRGFETPGTTAYGGSNTNTWNLAQIKQYRLLENDRVRMSQTPAHEFFHAVQIRLIKAPGFAPDGRDIPQWFVEGPALMVGYMTNAYCGLSDFQTVARKQVLDRYAGGPTQTRAGALRDMKQNIPGSIDVYAIGYAGTEYLVASAGMERFVDVYRQMGTGKTFPDAFLAATGRTLDSFYDAFEAARGGLGFARQPI